MGWTDVASIQPPPEVYAAVYAQVKQNTMVFAEADDHTLHMAMRWAGAIKGAIPFKPGRGYHLVDNQQEALLNFKTGLPYGCVHAGVLICFRACCL